MISVNYSEVFFRLFKLPTHAQDSYVGADRFYSYYLVINRLSVLIM